MNVIVPINLAALRVTSSDNNSVVSQFKGRTALFDQLPYGNTTSASTGDTISQPLQSPSTSANPLNIGMHLHWELPDFFRKGTQRAGGDVVFPPAPNRWLVVRSLCVWNTTSNTYDDVQFKSFIVESDYIGTSQWVDSYGMTHSSVPVPLPANPTLADVPYRYMGRSLDYTAWNPSTETPSQFLRSYKGSDQQFLQLNALGFVGPGFCSYYPECATVFGFWDHFMDLPQVGNALQNGTSIRFKATYQVIGWIDPSITDPVAGLAAEVTNAFNAYVQKCEAEGVTLDKTPADIFESTVQQDYRWSIANLDPQASISTLPLPSATLLNGTLQEIIWDQLTNPGTTSFLTTPTGAAVWQSQVEVAVGNTTVEALSALLAADMGTPISPDVLGAMSIC